MHTDLRMRSFVKIYCKRFIINRINDFQTVFKQEICVHSDHKAVSGLVCNVGILHDLILMSQGT